MSDDDFARLLREYLDPPHSPNPKMVGVKLVWERGTLAYGALHIWDKHKVTEAEVEQVIFEVPPMVDARRNPAYPGRTAFIGRTRDDRELVVICEDWNERGVRHLKPITAFEPSKGRDYWENL